MPTATNQQLIAGMYAAVFSRAPDQAGLTFWETSFANNGADAAFLEIATGFTNHEAFTVEYPSTMTNQAFVEKIYTNVLGNAGDAAGIAFWVAALDGGTSKAAFLAEYVKSALTVDLSTLGLTAEELAAATIRQNMFINKANVGINFAETLGATSDVAAGVDQNSLAALQADAAFQASVNILKGVTEDTATATAANALITTAAASADPITAINTTDIVPPAFTSAAVDGTSLVLTYGEALDTASVPAVGDFAVTVGGTAATVSSLAVSGSTVTLTLASAVAAGSAVTVAYTKPASNPLQDAAGNDVVTLAAAAVTNNAVAGQTFTLTNSTDNLAGDTGNDTFIGDNVSTSAGDTLNGNGGTDSLLLFGNAPEPNHSNIEVVTLTGNTLGFDVSDNSAVTTLNLVDPTDAQTYTTRSGQKASVSTMVAGETVDFAGNTVTSLDLTVDGLSTTGADVTIDLNSTAQTTLNLTTTNNRSQITLTNTGAVLTTLNVAGDMPLEVGSALALTTINASTSTGGVDVDALAASNLTFTGGTGNDRIAMAATLTASDVLDGGAGTDTFGVSVAYTAATTIGVKNFEVVEIDAAAVTQDLSLLNSDNTLTGLVLAEAAAGATVVTGINDATASNIRLTADNTTTALTVASHVSGGTSDAATLIFDDSATNGSGVDIATSLTMVNVDTLTIQSVSDGTPVTGEENSIVGLTATDMDKLTVTGNQSINIATAATTVALTEVDASGLTVETGGVFTFNSSASAITSLLIKGTAQNDVLNISANGTAGTIYTGGNASGGVDALTIDTGQASSLQFTTTALGSGDLAAGTNITIATATAAGDIVLNMTSAVEAALKFGGVTLGTSAADVTINAAISATNNIGYTEAGGNSFIQIDLNGDGAYSATSDIQIQITGGAATLAGLQYTAATDTFITV